MKIEQFFFSEFILMSKVSLGEDSDSYIYVIYKMDVVC